MDTLLSPQFFNLSFAERLIVSGTILVCILTRSAGAEGLVAKIPICGSASCATSHDDAYNRRPGPHIQVRNFRIFRF